MMENYNEENYTRTDYKGTFTRAYSLNGISHRTDGPAFIEYYDNGIYYEGYYLNGNRHNIKGPARVWYKQNGEINIIQYYIFGHQITEEQFHTPGFIDSFILENS